MAVGLAACVSAFHTSPCSLKVTGRFSLRSAKFTGPLSQRKGTRDDTLLQEDIWKAAFAVVPNQVRQAELPGQ